MLLKLENISKSFKIAGKKTLVLNDLSFEMNEGEIVSITGKSGCGKSTMLNIIAGLINANKGKIFLREKRIRNFFDIITSRRRNREFGFIFQNFRLLNNETVKSNILLPARIRGKVNKEVSLYADELMTKLDIAEYKNTKTGRLSGGQKQRVAIARALINKPSMILADEPTANLDKKTALEIFSILQNIKKQGTAILIITHTDYMHKKSNRTYLMENGVLKKV
jgi:ABC-type lipoprotein export system ATPase subunit